jgi:hypothetical protein
MSDSSPFLVLEGPSDEAIAWVMHRLGKAGLQSLLTFDLQLARSDPADCPCPQHGTDQCNCQMIVLLVYRDGCQPVSLIAHGSEGRTWLSLIDSLQQRADPRLEHAIRQALLTEKLPTTELTGRFLSSCA